MRTIPLLAAAALLTMAPSASAQVDWGSMIQSEAMGSAIAEAGREGSRASSRPRARSRVATSGTSQSRAQARSSCRRIRGWAAEGRDLPDLGRMLRLCKQNGY